MKKHALALAALSLMSVTAAYAEEAKPDWTFTGNAGLFSDYRFRGYTQTAYKPAFQGGFDLSHVSGFYVGNWNSNVEQALYRGATLEMDFYGGYKMSAGPVGLDFGAIYYYYPSSGTGSASKQVHQDELYVGASFSYFTAKFSYGLSNFFGAGDDTTVSTDGNYYLDLGFAYDLGQGWGINAHYGYQKVPHAKDLPTPFVDDTASDYKVGVTKDFSGWIAGASLIGTSKKDFAVTGLDATKGAGKTGVVLSLSKSF